MLNTLSFRNKLLLWVMPILILGLLSLSAGAYWYITNVIEKELTTSMLNTTGKTAEGINTWCKTLIFEPEAMSTTPAAKDINVNFSKIDLQNINRNKVLQKKYPGLFLDIYLANRDGTYHAITNTNTNDSFFEGNISDRGYFKAIMAGKSAQITFPLISRTTNIPTIFVVAPITNDDGVPQGLMGTGISLEYVQTIAESLKAGETGYGFVIAQDGTFIYHPKKEIIMKKKITDAPDPTVIELGYLMLSGGAGIYHYVLAGEPKVAFYQPVPFTGWSIATTIPERELFAPVSKMIHSLVTITLTILLLVVSAIWLATRHLLQPLQNLSTHTQQITAGNFNVDLVTVTSEDEIGLLTRNFNSMTLSLQQAYDSLESKVQEKTKELFSANEELTAINDILEDTNKRLEDEIEVRLQVEDDLLTRESQYRATTCLLTRPIDEVEYCLESILVNALQLIKAPDGFIGLYDHDKQLFSIHHAIGIHKSRVITPMASTSGVQAHVYKTGKTLYIDDYKTSSHRIQDPALQRLSSIILLPLKQDNQVMGLLAASWVDHVHPVSQEHIEILQQYGDLASVALERSNIYETNHHMAFHDALTGLPNRARLHQYLEEEMQKTHNGKSMGAILFIDMDDLKSVNDNFGHSSGDLVIIAASKHLQSALGEKAFVARLGGDEFIAIITDEQILEKAPSIADKVINALQQEYDVAGQKIHLSASIGVVLYPTDGNVVEDLLKKADSAMYAAKKAGRKCWRFYEPILLQESYEKIMLTNALHYALERQELFLQYQPQFTIDGRTILGFEALIRWNNPAYGLVSPLRFIPLAEQSGLILPIGKWVLTEACQFVRRLSDMGRQDVHVAVNISPKQLQTDDFVADVRTSIINAGIEPRQITIEVTESVLIETMEKSIRKLEQLRDFGVSLALDDFGTGYSSLTYLKSLPVNILKIDKSFIDKNTSNDTDLQLVGSIINLGHTLDLTIVAEGVETASQLELLKQYGCDCIQGYIFSRPLSEQAAMELLSK